MSNVWHQGQVVGDVAFHFNESHVVIVDPFIDCSSADINEAIILPIKPLTRQDTKNQEKGDKKAFDQRVAFKRHKYRFHHHSRR